MTLFLYALTLGAHAQTFDFAAPTQIFTPDTISWGDGTTIGSPTAVGHVAGSGVGNTATLLLYETRITDPASSAAGCPAGTWGIGLASRFSNGSFRDAGPVVLPDDNYYTCVAAHPAIVTLDADTWLVYFKAEQNPDTCDSVDELNWGCDRFPGVGRFIVQFDGRTGSTLNYSITAVDPTPVMSEVAQNMGYPSVMFANSEYHMMFGQFPDLYLTSSAASGNFSTPAFPEITANSSLIGWDEDELLSPSLSCNGSTDFKAFVSGRIYDTSGVIVDQALGLYQSTDLVTWTENAQSPLFRLSDGDPEMRHISMLTSGGHTGFALFYTSPDPATGDNVLWLRTTTAWDRRAIDTQRCP